MPDSYVYVYIDPKDNIPFYVGKGRGARDQRHCENWNLENPRTFFYRKLAKLFREGRQPIIHRLVDRIADSEAKTAEIFFIHAMGRRNDPTNPGPLCNLTNGGDGTVGYIPTPEAGAKNAEAQRNQSSETRRKRAEAAKRTRNHLGHAHSEAVREKIRAARARQVITAEHRQAMSVALTGRKMSVEARAKMSAARTGKPTSDAHRKAASAAKRGRKLSEQHKQAIRHGHLFRRFLMDCSKSSLPTTEEVQQWLKR